MELDPTISANRELIKRIAAEHGARNVRVFGSRVRGQARPDSDVDLLVERGARTSSWFPAGLVLDLGRRARTPGGRGDRAGTGPGRAPPRPSRRGPAVMVRATRRTQAHMPELKQRIPPMLAETSRS